MLEAALFLALLMALSPDFLRDFLKVFWRFWKAPLDKSMKVVGKVLSFIVEGRSFSFPGSVFVFVFCLEGKKNLSIPS